MGFVYYVAPSLPLPHQTSLQAAEIMATVLIPQVDLGTQGLNLDSVAHLGQALLVATQENYEEILDWVTSNSTRFTISVDVSELIVTSNIHNILDAGAARVFVQQDQLEHLLPNIPNDRLVRILDMTHGNFDFTDTVAGTPMGIYAKKVNSLEGFTGWLKGFGGQCNRTCGWSPKPLLPLHTGLSLFPRLTKSKPIRYCGKDARK